MASVPGLNQDPTVQGVVFLCMNSFFIRCFPPVQYIKRFEATRRRPRSERSERASAGARVCGARRRAPATARLATARRGLQVRGGGGGRQCACGAGTRGRGCDAKHAQRKAQRDDLIPPPAPGARVLDTAHLTPITASPPPGLRSAGGPKLLKWGLPGRGVKSAKVRPTP